MESVPRPALSHFYHVFADGNWQTPVTEHLDHLERSGLAAALDSFGVGIVGSHLNRLEVIDFIDRRLQIDHLAEAEDGWEQVTLNLMLDRMGDSLVLYAHTKTAANYSDMHDQWRKSMTYFMVHRWRECVELLGEYDTVGCHRIEPEDGNPLQGFWGGNYWWARSEWLRTVPPLSYESRYHAEAWIGYGDGRRFDMNPGWPDPSIFVTEW